MAPEILSTLIPISFGLFFVGVGCHVINLGHKQSAQSDRVTDTTTSSISSLQPGAIGVEGIARPAEDATVRKSPIEMDDALVARVTVEKNTASEGTNWKIIHEETIREPLVVDDRTGEIRVEFPLDGELIVEQMQTEVHSGHEPPERIQRYVETEPNVDEAPRRRYGPVGVGEHRRYTEEVIEPGENVYVLGTAREIQGSWGEQKYLIDEPTEAGDFVLSDQSKDEVVQRLKRTGSKRLAAGGLFVVIGILCISWPWL
ncbi:GIDE domain-containing protein [Haloterrigena salina]|uniref:GIDE domain-containing protein n=1 Tax=Haloterrigena salina TaxID=504937 RepID=UPI000A067A9A|nr:GIDE domain-containing protein [Haloterrigena salina]